ncbi:ATP-binding protein [Nonomuraea sp. NPDC049419]|uniref:ATP-binding protein n=1 Tax=Nonomuraea sp. NPDC049419 TaxID=3155772 RepID=UPI00341BE3CA
MNFDWEGLLRLVANHLYSEKKVFIRELIQNAHDGIRRRARNDAGFGRIDIETRPQDLEITVRDNGIGMNDEDLIHYLSSIGKSFTRLQQENTEGLIGQFGIGFLSAFVVARRVQVRTRKLNEEQGWLWENDGSKEYRLTPCEVSAPGTTVIVSLQGEEDRGLIQESEVRNLIRKYADMLTVPIHLNGGSEPENTMHMPWEKAGITEGELRFDLHAYLTKTMSDSVLEAIPVRLNEPVRVEGVLYISRTRLVNIDQPRTVRVFQNRMFLCENAADVLPTWARFVNGVINTPDLTPTAARDNFIRDEAAGRLSAALGDVIIRHLEGLRQSDPERFTDIIRYHRLGFLAACYYYDAFFEKFAHLLLWRTNDRVPGRADTGLPKPAEVLRTLPEIIADIPRDEGEPVRLACFTTASTASQYFDVANAAGRVVVDASYPFESELLEAYTRLPDVRLELVHVDREDDPGFFSPPDAEENQQVLGLAETMSLVLRTPAGAGIRVEAKRFKPVDIAAVLRSDAVTRAQQKAEEVRLDPNVSDDLREMAEELTRMTAHQSRRLTINADNSLIRRLARHDLNSPDVRELMLGVYNNAILANQELITKQDAAIFHHQFQDLIAKGLELLEVREELLASQERMRREEERRRPTQRARHRIFFMITPFADRYTPLISACRRVVEERWKAQLIVASDQHADHRLLENVESLMSQAHGFLAEITHANPNVMFELGAAFAERHRRPFALLREQSQSPDLPADLRSLLYIDYTLDAADLDGHLNQELRKNTQIRELIDGAGWDSYVSPAKLRSIIPINLQQSVIERLATRFPTAEDWARATREDVAAILGKGDEDFADAILNRTQHKL